MCEATNLVEKFDAFHDWYLMGFGADRDNGIVELALLFDNKRDRVNLFFKGVTRCLVSDFLIQNIISELKILTDFDSPNYRHALSELERSYFGKENWPNKLIASVSATIGAELFIEFDTLEVVS